jgi:hypothetical protein
VKRKVASRCTLANLSVSDPSMLHKLKLGLRPYHCECSLWPWQYHHDKATMMSISNGTFVPNTFRMHWTQFKSEKLQYLREAKLWYTSDRCDDDGLWDLLDSNRDRERGGSWYEVCCRAFSR